MIGRKIRRGSMLLLLAGMAGLALAAPLSFVPQRLVQPNGSVLQCFASGDEYYNWLHDALGYTIVQDAQTGYYAYAMPGKEGLVASSLLPGRDNPALFGVKPWLTISTAAIQTKRQAMLAAVPGPVVNAPTLGSFTNITIFIRFADEDEFTDTFLKYDQMFNLSAGGKNSLINYYREVSYGAVTITSKLYPDPAPGTTVVSFRDSHPRGYYQPYNASTNPIGYSESDPDERRGRENLLLKAAVDFVGPTIPASVNPDSDNDGLVDNVVFVVRGNPTAWATLLWPHKSSLSVIARINGKLVSTFNLLMETTIDVGTLAHEMGHSLGAPDLYHYTSTPVTPVGSWDVMATSVVTPMHWGAYLKYKYGKWIGSLPVLTTPGTYWLKPVTSPTNSIYKIPSPYSTSEYFVLEYRKKVGIFEKNLPGEGLLVYRIDSRHIGNAPGPPDEVYIYRPAGTPTINGMLNSAAFSAELGRTMINDETSPSTFLQSGAPGGLSITGVGTRGDSISFVLGSPLTVVIDSFAALYVRSDSIVISWWALAQYRSLAFELEMSDTASGGYIPVPGSSLKGGGTTSGPMRYSFVDKLNPGKKYYRIKEIDSSSVTSYSTKLARVDFPTPVAAEKAASPERFALLQNYPNPFNPSTVIQFSLKSPELATLKVYDVLGREVAVLADERKEPGSYEVRFDAVGLASGVYVYRLEAGAFVQSRKMLLLH